MKKWEYRKIQYNPVPFSANVDNELNEFGENGWELVSVIVSGAFRAYYFKREKPGSWGSY